MELHCLYCKSGRAVLADGMEWICDNCGAILDTLELYDMSHPYLHTSADTDVPLEYRNTKDKKGEFMEEAYGRSTRAIRKKQELKVPIVDREALMTRIQQKNMVESDICDICEQLALQPQKVLNRFDTLLKKVGINDMLKTDNIITNKRHKRSPSVIAAGLIYKVHRNKVTFRQVKRAAKCGNKSLQKILRLLT